MKVLHVADLHVGLHRYGIDYGLLATERLVDWVGHHQPDLVTLGGDTFHVRRPAPGDIAIVVSTINDILRTGASVAVAEGNHDGSTTVAGEYTSSVAWMSLLPWDVHAFPRGINSAVVRTRGGDVAIGSFPFPHHTAGDPAPAIVEGAAWMRDTFRHADVHLYLGHLSVLGALNGAEQSLYLGNDWKVDPSVFDGYDLALLGHIHHRQHHGKAWYPGSPERVDFAEREQSKGFLLLDSDGDDWAVTVLATNPPPMLDLTEERLDADVEGALVRVTLPPGTPSSEQAAAVRSLRGRGARWVKVIVPPTERKRLTVVVETLGPTEQLRRWLISQDSPLEPAMTLAEEVMVDV